MEAVTLGVELVLAVTEGEMVTVGLTVGLADTVAETV